MIRRCKGIIHKPLSNSKGAPPFCKRLFRLKAPGPHATLPPMTALRGHA
jgi:hypothetical protein